VSPVCWRVGSLSAAPMGHPRHDSLSAVREYQGLPKRLRPTQSLRRDHVGRIVGAFKGLQAAGSDSSSVTAVQELSGSKALMASTAVAVSSPRSFWKTTPSWLTMKVITPLEP